MFNRSRALLGAAMAIAVAGGMAPVMPSTIHPQVSVSSKRKKGLFNGLPYLGSGALIGTRASRNTVARDKRAAAKRRSQLRHKRARRA